MNKSLTNNVVSKSAELVKARYSMTLNEQRVLLACISQINSFAEIEHDAVFTLTVEQFQEVFYKNNSEKNAYRDLKEAVENIFQREVRIALPDNRELLTRFVHSAIFDPDNKRVELSFSPKITPYLATFKQKFASYRLQYVAQLSSIYAIRIYELLVGWFGRDGKYNTNTIEIIELREILDITEKYVQFGELRSRVIQPAVEQINANTDFQVSVEYIKDRRSFKWIKFNFKRVPEIAEADQKARAERWERNVHNWQAQEKRELGEEKQRARERMAQRGREAAEQQRENKAAALSVLETKRKYGLALWDTLDGEKQQEVFSIMRTNIGSIQREILENYIQKDDIKGLVARFQNLFLEALEVLGYGKDDEGVQETGAVCHTPAAPVVSKKQQSNYQMYKDGVISQDELLVLLTREELLQMYKDGVISQDELLELLKKTK